MQLLNCHLAIQTMAFLRVFLLLGFVSIGFGCPNGWLTHNNKCYHFSRETETWLGAAQMCAFMKGTLVEIETKDENYYLKAQASTTRHGDFWIALSDVEEENSWRWMISSTPAANETFTDWNPGQPNNSGGQECAALHRDFNYSWNDDDCRTNHYYICEKSNSDKTQFIG
ncbi:chromatin-modulating protein mrc1 [Mactra antiquata]